MKIPELVQEEIVALVEKISEEMIKEKGKLWWKPVNMDPYFNINLEACSLINILRQHPISKTYPEWFISKIQNQTAVVIYSYIAYITQLILIDESQYAEMTEKHFDYYKTIEDITLFINRIDMMHCKDTQFINTVVRYKSDIHQARMLDIISGCILLLPNVRVMDYEREYYMRVLFKMLHALYLEYNGLSLEKVVELFGKLTISFPAKDKKVFEIPVI